MLVLRDPDFTWLGTKLALLVISEMAVVIMVGCSPVLPRLFVYIRGPPRSQESSVGKNMITTIGGSGGNKKPRSRGPLASSIAKYMGAKGLTGMTTLRSTTPASEEDQIQLRPYAGGEVDEESVRSPFPQQLSSL